MKKIIACAYNIKSANWKLVINNAKLTDNYALTLKDVLESTIKYGIAPQEYFYFDFYNKSKTERSMWAGQTTMWLAHRKFVKKDLIKNFSNKENFFIRFNKLMAPGTTFLDTSIGKDELEAILLPWVGSSLFFKPNDGQVGFGAFKVKVTPDLSSVSSQIIKSFAKTKSDKYILEPCLENSQELRTVNPTSLNTIRVITRHNSKSGKTDIMYSRIRFGVGGDVDNLGAGGLAAAVDKDTGEIFTDAVSTSNGRTSYHSTHPISNTVFKGFKVPNWGKVIEVVTEAAKIIPEARVIGWDVAITDKGVYILEGNHNWCKLLWQLPVNKGLKSELKSY